jgi:acyl carrier protein
MTSDPTAVLTDLRTLLREATGEDAGWADRIAPHSRLEDDLGLDSVEVAELGELLRRRYGSAVDLPAYLAGLDVDRLFAVTVADLVELVANPR